MLLGMVMEADTTAAYKEAFRWAHRMEEANQRGGKKKNHQNAARPAYRI